MKELSIAQRLVVALDFDPTKTGGVKSAIKNLFALAEEMINTGVVVKVNSLLRVYGYNMVTELRKLGLQTFADLKLIDIGNTLTNDGHCLKEYPPDMVTVMCSNSVSALHDFQQAIGGQTEVLGVTVLTHLNTEHCRYIYGCDPPEAFQRFALLANSAGLDGLILSAQELRSYPPELNHLIKVCPGIRPAWATVEGDDQARVMTPQEAIALGADRIVVGRPITQHVAPAEAVAMTLDEIEQGLAQRV